MYIRFCFAVALLSALSTRGMAQYGNVMIPEHFAKEWGGELIKYTSEQLESVSLGKPSKTFLSEVGLPLDATPYFSFDRRMYYEGLRSVKEAYELKNDDFKHHYLIGSIDGGDICINSDANDRIYIISSGYIYDVENRVDISYYHPDHIPVMFVNSSVAQLAHCLLVYRTFINDIRSSKDQQSYLEVEPSEEELAGLRNRLLKVDKHCLTEKSFWWGETGMNVKKVEPIRGVILRD